MITTGIEFEKFISSYKHINYFECIMFPDGTLVEANPSHTYKMCEIYDNTKTIQEIDSIIPLGESPIDWLLAKTGCVALWHCTIMIDYRVQVINEVQKKNIIELVNRGYMNIDLRTFDILERAKKDYESYINNLDEETKKYIIEKRG